MIKNLLEKAARDLCIDKEPDETGEKWTRRVRYSIIGLQMLASVYDQDDDVIVDVDSPKHDAESTVPMRRILYRGKRLAEIFDEKNFNVEEVRELYIRNGFLLHKNHRLAYPVSSYAEAGNSFLARGVPPWKAAKVSGLGMLTQWKASVASLSVKDMFNIEQAAIGDWFDQFTSTIIWKTDSLPQEVEWLNIHESHEKGYWSGKRPDKGFSLCRTKSDPAKDYFLWQISNGIEQQCRLPTWRSEKGEYRRIAIILRTLHNNRPNVVIKKQVHTITVTFNYLLPPTEQHFIELYSWSKLENPWDIKGRLNRIFAIDLYAVVKTIFEQLSYEIREKQ